MPHGTPADFRIPAKESGRKGFAVDVGPTRGIDHEAKHVLFATIESGPTVRRFLRRLEVRGKLADNGKQIRVP